MKDNWISVDEQDPPMTAFNPPDHPDVMGEHQPMLVCTDGGRVMETIKTGLGFSDIPPGHTVTHWQPLPEPCRVVEYTEATDEDRELANEIRGLFVTPMKGMMGHEDYMKQFNDWEDKISGMIALHRVTSLVGDREPTEEEIEYGKSLNPQVADIQPPSNEK